MQSTNEESVVSPGGGGGCSGGGGGAGGFEFGLKTTLDGDIWFRFTVSSLASELALITGLIFMAAW